MLGAQPAIGRPFIADTVAALDLGPFYQPYEGDGRRNQPFDPRLMVTVLLYAYATGTFWSRRIEATFQTLETRDITAYISLGREGKPDTTPNPAHQATHRMAARLASEGGRTRYRRRKAIVEPVFGWIKVSSDDASPSRDVRMDAELLPIGGRVSAAQAPSQVWP